MHIELQMIERSIRGTIEDRDIWGGNDDKVKLRIHKTENECLSCIICKEAESLLCAT